jgi:hypothetical protein
MNNLSDIIQERLSKSHFPEVDIFKDEFLKRYGDTLLGVLFYGSCLRTGKFKDNVADFYLILSELPKDKRIHKILGTLLPPNVYYIELPYGNEILRAKYGIFTHKQFITMSSINSFEPYLWARLVQPMELVYVKNENFKKEIISCVLNASNTMLFNSLPIVKSPFDPQKLWLKAFCLTYQSEIRPESSKHILSIYNINKEYLLMITEPILNILPYPIIKYSYTDNFVSYISLRLKILKYISWAMRTVNGKIKSALRLMKATITFENAIQYGYYKLSKHIADVKVPKLVEKSKFFSCGYIFLVGIKRNLFKRKYNVV